MTNVERIQRIIKNNNGFVSRSDINKESIPSWVLTYYVRKNGLVKISPGFYALPSFGFDASFILQKRYPKAIFSNMFSLYLNHLTDKIPDSMEITIPHNYRIRDGAFPALLVHVERNLSAYEQGNKKCQTIFGNQVEAYGPEKTIVEMIRKRKEYDPETFVKAISLFQKRKDKDLAFLYEYSRIRGIEEEVYQVMELAQGIHEQR